MSETDDQNTYKDAVRALRHDARNLLNGISIMADHFEGSEDAKAVRFVGYLNDKVEAMVRLGERAETFASLELKERSDQDLGAMLSGIFEKLSIETSPRLNLEEGRLRCDPALTRLALCEVIENAVLTGAKVEITSVREGPDSVLVTVQDQGPGVSEPATPHLFVPFKGAKRAGGASLGLPIAKKAMELQGGSLELEGAVGGTKVVCRFPGQG